MRISRRKLLQVAGTALAGGPFLAKAIRAADEPASFARPGQMHLGMVTYNIGKDWDVSTIIKNCTEAQFEGVELRTGHKHGVEVNLSKGERQEIKERFAQSKVQLMGLGSAFEYHTVDQTKLRRDIEDTKAYIVLAHDVGASGVKVRPNALPKEVSIDKTLEQIGRSLGELGKFANEYGLKIRLEAHGTGTSLIPRIARIMQVADQPNVGVCWNSNQSDLEGAGFDPNFDLVKDKIFSAHMRDLYLEEYPFHRLLTRLNESGFSGFCLAEIPESTDPVRVMKYFRGLWLAYQNRL